MATKQKYNFRLSNDAKRLLEKMATDMGIPQTNVLELAIRAMATEKGINDKPVNRSESTQQKEIPS